MADKGKIILLDTNFLLIPAQFKVDIFAELRRVCDFNYELAVLDATVDELNSLVADKAQSAKDRRAAKLGLQLIKAKAVRVIRTDRKVFKSTDKAILDFATAGSHSSVVVATQDKALRNKLAMSKIAVVALREKQYLKFL